ncbi:hypothetical protein HK101_004665 [Irineochytrium annulatum]|nr:hypothetical protein HK101_004665 [Irineochytrium annulatum]
MKDANISDMSKCFFVDDAAINVDAAQKLGWTSVHVADSLPSSHGAHQILRVHELPSVLPQLFEKQ